MAIAVLGGLAAAYALHADDQLELSVPLLPLLSALARQSTIQAITGAFAIIMLVHAVETAKFALAWTDYKAAVRSLATGTASDPDLRDARFVSAHRNSPELDRSPWCSTAHFLAVLLAPGLVPPPPAVYPP